MVWLMLSPDSGVDMRYPAIPPPFLGTYTINCGQLNDISHLKTSIYKSSEALKESANIVETAANLLALNDLTNRLTNILKDAKVYG